MAKILITGGSGQVGRALLASVPQGMEVIAPPRNALDLSRPETLEQAVRAFAPEAILHAGAY
ncbi:MAG: sugar nucleotide-binding protein, partial [Holosporales bacterium]